MAVGVALGKAHEPLEIGGGLPGVGDLQGAGLAVHEAGLHLPAHHFALLIHHEHAGDVAQGFRCQGFRFLEHERCLAGAAIAGAGEPDVGHNWFIHTAEELNGSAHAHRSKNRS